MIFAVTFCLLTVIVLYKSKHIATFNAAFVAIETKPEGDFSGKVREAPPSSFPSIARPKAPFWEDRQSVSQNDIKFNMTLNKVLSTHLSAKS